MDGRGNSAQWAMPRLMRRSLADAQSMGLPHRPFLAIDPGKHIPADYTPRCFGTTRVPTSYSDVLQLNKNSDQY